MEELDKLVNQKMSEKCLSANEIKIKKTEVYFLFYDLQNI
jgi:hypothetical protein